MGDDVLGRIVALRACGKHSWAEIGACVGLTAEATRSKWRRRPSGMVPDACPICGRKETRERLSFEEEGNYAKAQSQSTRIRTLEELLEATEVDLGIWQVRDWGVKKWEVGAKVKEGHLEWTEGRLDGHLDYMGLGVQDLWSVWAKFVRKEPISLFPVVQPVGCEARYRAPENEKRELGVVMRALVMADPHFGFSREVPSARLGPFHDRGVLDVVLQVAAEEQPDEIYVLGDCFDFVMWTDRFLRSPKFEYTTQPAIMEAHWWLRQLREACPDARIVVHEGNHDKRMKASIMTHLRAAYGLRAADEFELPAALSPERLLALHKLGISWVGGYPDDASWLGSALRLGHGDVAKAVPGATARGIAEGSDVSVIFGHIHRKERVARTLHVRDGQRTITAYCPGCVCRIDGAVPGKRKRMNWQQGFALVDYWLDEFTIYDVEVREGRALWDGQVFEARDRVEDLRGDLPEWRW